MSTYEIWSLVLATMMLLVTSMIITEISVMKKHKRSEHEENRRANTILP